MSAEDRLFVLDTNVLIHDPTSIFRFKEHDVFVPMSVLEELDAAKQGVSEMSRNAREVSRFLDGLIGRADRAAIESGLPLPGLANSPLTRASGGRLFLQTEAMEAAAPTVICGDIPGNSIVRTILALQADRPDRDVTLVSKDINLRIKARVLGINAEDYYNDKVLDDTDLLYTGVRALEDVIPGRYGDKLECWQEDGTVYYSLPSECFDDFYPNECLYSADDDGLEVIARSNEGTRIVLEQARDYRNPRHAIWGITARNREQNFAMNVLMDPDIEFVTLIGAAGTGKTLLALAAGLSQSMETKAYHEIIVTRVTVPLGEDIGFLPGTEEEKMTPWMGALLDNMEILAHTEEGGEWGRAASADLLRHRIKIRSLNFMRGRTFLNRYIIVDEAQNLTAKQMQTLITRAGPGTKVICLGNIAQIDTPYLSETTSGLTYVVDRFKRWKHSAHITLLRGERSRLADFASENL